MRKGHRGAWPWAGPPARVSTWASRTPHPQRSQTPLSLFLGSVGELDWSERGGSGTSSWKQAAWGRYSPSFCAQEAAAPMTLLMELLVPDAHLRRKTAAACLPPRGPPCRLGWPLLAAAPEPTFMTSAAPFTFVRSAEIQIPTSVPLSTL